MSSTQLGQVRHQVADPLAALAVLLPLPGALHHAPGRALEQLDLAAGVELLAVLLDQQRLVVERVALAGRARHEQLRRPASPCAGWCSPPFHSGRGRAQAPRRSRQQALRAEQVRQGDAAEAAAGSPEEFGERSIHGSRVSIGTAPVAHSRSNARSQSMNRNSLVLNSTRQALARPCFAA